LEREAFRIAEAISPERADTLNPGEELELLEESIIMPVWEEVELERCKLCKL
tara:strand:- start:684 stop:839 length:156 start_codon:yes stop_codon:yes gene_type:complete